MILEPYIMSGELKAATSLTFQVSALPGLLMAVDLIPPSSGNALIKIYDSDVGVTSTATCVFEAQITTATSTNSLSLPMARYLRKGIYVVITDSSTSCIANVGFSIA